MANICTERSKSNICPEKPGNNANVTPMPMQNDTLDKPVIYISVYNIVYTIQFSNQTHTISGSKAWANNRYYRISLTQYRILHSCYDILRILFWKRKCTLSCCGSRGNVAWYLSRWGFYYSWTGLMVHGGMHAVLSDNNIVFHYICAE